MATTVVFYQTLPTIKDAGIALRGAVGSIDPLSDSLLGKNPGPAEPLGINPALHQAVRRFTNEREMVAYCDYLDALIGVAASRGRKDLPTFRYNADGIYYRVHSQHAEVKVFRATEGWRVEGRARFAATPTIVVRKLHHEGFAVRVAQH